MNFTKPSYKSTHKPTSKPSHKPSKPTHKKTRVQTKYCQAWGWQLAFIYLEVLEQQIKGQNAMFAAILSQDTKIYIDGSHLDKRQEKALESFHKYHIPIITEKTTAIDEPYHSLSHYHIAIQNPWIPKQDLSACWDIAGNATESINDNLAEDMAGIHNKHAAMEAIKPSLFSVVILDHILDEHNFGSIMRTAHFFGVKTIVYSKFRQAPVSSLVLKSSMGGLWGIQLVEVSSIASAIGELQENGFWVFGASLKTHYKPVSTKMSWAQSDKCALVLGNESNGLSVHVENLCDFYIHVPGGSAIVDSLNVSVANGILLGTPIEHLKVQTL
jgi:predicted rRNA methylase